MSGTVDPDDEDVRAGEYVLGLAEPADAGTIEAEASRNASLAASIGGWERRLAPLYAAIRAVDPPPSLWTRLERNAFGADLSGTPRIASARARPAAAGRVPPGLIPDGRTPDGRTSQGRVPQGRIPHGRFPLWGAGLAGFALAAALAGIAILQRPAVPPPVAVAALLPKTPGAPIIVAELLPSGALSLQPVGPLAPPAAHDYELWSLPTGATRPVALGLLRPGGVVLTADHVPQGAGQILVSLEPTGGSPTGLPTGPVLWGGAYAGHT